MAQNEEEARRKRRRLSGRRSYQKHKDKQIAKARNYYAANKQKCREYGRAYAAANREKALEYGRRSYAKRRAAAIAADPSLDKRATRKREARQRPALTAAQIAERKAKHDAQKAAWRVRNPDKVAAQNRRSHAKARAKDPAAYRAKIAAYKQAERAKKRAENPEAMAEARRLIDLRYYERHRIEHIASAARWRRQNPERYKAQYKRYYEIKRAAAGIKPRRRGRKPVADPRKHQGAEQREQRLLQLAAYAAARAAIPDHLPPHVRDDVIGEILLAHIEGRLEVAAISAAAPAIIRAYWKQRDLFKTVSLDASVPGTDVRYIDILRAPEP